MGQDQRGGAWVVAPEEKGAAVAEIRRGEINAEGIAEACVSMPVAHLGGGDPVRAAERVKKSSQPALGIIDGGPAGGALDQGDGLGAVTLADGAQPLRDGIERLIPTGPLPTRVSIALGASASQGIVETVGMVDQFRRRLALDADHPAVGMIRIRIEPGYPTVLDGGYGGAVRRAEGA